MLFLEVDCQAPYFIPYEQPIERHCQRIGLNQSQKAIPQELERRASHSNGGNEERTGITR